MKRADELTTYELACVRAMEAILPVNETLESVRHELEHTVQQLRGAQASEAQLRLEVARERRLSEVSAESHKLEYSTLDQRCRRLTGLLEAETAARRIVEDKAAMHDKLLEENQALISQVRWLCRLIAATIRLLCPST